MRRTAIFHRAATAAALLLAAGLMVVSVLLQPAFPDNALERLTAIEEAGTPGMISALAFSLAQPAFIVAMLGTAQLLRSRSPIMSILVGSFGLIGGFGHAVFGGISMMTLAMAADTTNHEVHSAILMRVEEGPAVVFMAMGLLGTVLGILFLAIGLWRAHVGPRWVPFVLVGFLLLEFVGTSFSEWAAAASALLYLAAFVVLAAVVWRSPLLSWSALDPAGPSPRVQAGAQTPGAPQTAV